MTTAEKTLTTVCLLAIPGVILWPAMVMPIVEIPTSEVSAEFPSPRLLFALRSVESSLRPDAVSDRGARGLYQIMPETWRDHSSEPFSKAFNPEISRIVAVRYLLWIQSTLNEWQGREPTLEEILSCWNGGIGRFRSRGYQTEKMPKETIEFVRRVKEIMK